MIINIYIYNCVQCVIILFHIRFYFKCKCNCVLHTKCTGMQMFMQNDTVRIYHVDMCLLYYPMFFCWWLIAELGNLGLLGPVLNCWPFKYG
jgi:hypothetical protein